MALRCIYLVILYGVLDLLYKLSRFELRIRCLVETENQ